MAAVQQDGSALQYASPTLKNDQAFVMAAVNQNAKALNFIGPSLRNPEFFKGLLSSIAIPENKGQSQEEMQSYQNGLKQRMGHYCKQFRQFGYKVLVKDIPKTLYKFLFPNLRLGNEISIAANFLSLQELSRLEMVCKDVHKESF